MASDGRAARGSPVTAQPMNRPSAPRRTVTMSASRTELRLLAPIC